MRHLFLLRFTDPRIIRTLHFSSCRGHLKKCQDGLQTMTAMCAELRRADVGRSVTLCGWLQHKRDVLNGNVVFLVLRDGSGATQVLLNNKVQLAEKLKSVPLESVLRVDGIVQSRPAGQENPRLATGEVEVVADELHVLNKSSVQLPFHIADCNRSNKVREDLLLRHRYLSLRSDAMQRVLRLRSEVNMLIREYLVRQHNFLEVETPTLFCRTPGGAQEFVVPTRLADRYYCLVQSPQQFKQLLMVGGVARYFQLARCYRDEGSRPDRQPEFTQLDLEMSFCSQQSVRQLVEQLLAHCWSSLSDKDLAGRQHHQHLTIPFPCLSYSQCQQLYGTDKPDLRIPWKIEELTDSLRTADDTCDDLTSALDECPNGGVFVLRIPSGAEHYPRSARQCDAQLAQSLHVPLLCALRPPVVSRVSPVHSAAGHWRALFSAGQSPLLERVADECGASPGDLLLVAAGDASACRRLLGALRPLMADRLEAAGVAARAAGWHFLWVVDFPLFEPCEAAEKVTPAAASALAQCAASGSSGQQRQQKLVSSHHPFTRPRADHCHLVYTHPEQVIGEHYDLVLNGCEVGGGSMRVHEPDLQRYILERVLAEDCSSLQHLLDALACGAPPHGGIALGMDRLIALLCGAGSIRDVLAFPKTVDGKDLMTGAPATISAQDRALYRL